MAEPLRQFLNESLAEEPIQLDDDEVITDAIVIYRISSIDVEDGRVQERYRYSVTEGVNLAMAHGMLHLTSTTLDDYYFECLREENEEDED
jgi:hypothetical protein